MKNSFNVQWSKRTFMLLFYDMIVVNVACFLALYLRFDLKIDNISKEYIDSVIHYIPIQTICAVVIFFFGKMYHSLWHYASLNELWRCLCTCILITLVQVIGMHIADLPVPRSYYPISFIIMFILEVFARFIYRIIGFFTKERFGNVKKTGRKNVMIVGAGSAGCMIIDELVDSRHLDYYVACIIDDMPGKQGRLVRGIPIVGKTSTIVENAVRYDIDIIMVAIPTLTAMEKKNVLEICQNTKCEIRVLPGVYQLVNGEATVSKMKKVEITDLLGREQIMVNNTEVANYVSGKVVLVTGGGGSIGSELCRQIASHNPKQLIIFDIYENNAYDIQQELKANYPNLNLVVLIGSVRNTHRINQVFSTYKPEIVYHAAAHKHVPLMEDSPNEAIKNNVFGTYKTATAAMINGTKRFVLISTDKAVNPTNIMGASKRLCEMIIQMLAKETTGTEFVAVRFGNVLGSNGSVIPLFKKQIEKGGPVTVTHKDIIRFFMTIPEAVSLVLQAGAYARGGEIFVLDMGAPVKIDDLARNMIRLSGFTPDVDIKVEYTGLRPGEKLYEEILMAEEGLKDTANSMIHIGKPIDIDYDIFKQQLGELEEACKLDDDVIKNKVSQIVTTYKVS